MFYGYIGKSTNPAKTEELSFALRYEILKGIGSLGGAANAHRETRTAHYPDLLICRRPGPISAFGEFLNQIVDTDVVSDNAFPRPFPSLNILENIKNYAGGNGWADAADVAGIGMSLDNHRQFSVCWLAQGQAEEIHVVDLRQTLGQIWFVQSIEGALEIWRAAYHFCKFTDNPHIIIFPRDQIWRMEQSHDGIWHIRKFRVTIERYYVSSESQPPIREQELTLDQLREQLSYLPIPPSPIARFNSEGGFSEN